MGAKFLSARESSVLTNAANAEFQRLILLELSAATWSWYHYMHLQLTTGVTTGRCCTSSYKIVKVGY